MQRAVDVKQSDPEKHRQFRAQAAKKLLDFVEKHPAHRQKFWGTIIGLLETAEADKMDDAMRIGLAGREVARNTPQGDKRAEQLLKAVIRSDKAAGELKASGLWLLELLKKR